MIVYDDVLASGWDSWSWSGSYTFDATDLVHAGSASILAAPDGFGALSLHSGAGFHSAAVRFWIEGDNPDVWLQLEADGEGYASDALELATVASIDPGVWTEVVVDLSRFGDHAWTRLDFFDNGSSATRFHLDDIELLDEVPVEAGWQGMEPVGAGTVVLYGAGDTAKVSVQYAGADVPFVVAGTEESPSRTLLSLSSPLTGDGTLRVRDGTNDWQVDVRGTAATVDPTTSFDISPEVYGMAFPPDAAYIGAHGVSVARWGGNATTLYNPAVPSTNLANDWYFENSASDDAETWLATMESAGAASFLSVPALDWVAKDTSACAYSVRLYGAQQATDPWRSDCGNGVRTDGTEITWNDPADAGAPWTAAALEAWLVTLPVAPAYVAIDNEMDIASSTHRDVHPDPVTYDELLDRWLEHADAVRAALPDSAIVGPSSCCWWFYWNSAAGDDDKAAHGGVDLLPFWLAEVRAHDEASGVRTLDYFDVHYYPDGEFNDDDDATTRARRLRSTRGLWDPTYTDEGWIGDDAWATQTQPDRNQVQLVPRMKALVAEAYPGTRFALTEWNWGAEWDASGGLAVADVLGILGREGVDLATYWTAPPDGSPAASAFTLYTDPDRPFGAVGHPVTFDDPDLLGVYAGEDRGRPTLVIVNKDPDHAVRASIAGWADPGTPLVVRHFSTEASAQVLTDTTQAFDGDILVPAYGAVLVYAETGGDTGGGSGDSGGNGGDSGSGDSGSGDSGSGDNGGADDTATGADKPATGCGCVTSDGGGASPFGGLLVAAGLVSAAAARRRASGS